MDHSGGRLLWPSQVEDRVVPRLLRPRGSRREAGGGRGQAPRHRRAHGLRGLLQATAPDQGSSDVREAGPLCSGVIMLRIYKFQQCLNKLRKDLSSHWLIFKALLFIFRNLFDL